jgi:hypothetical protein
MTEEVSEVMRPKTMRTTNEKWWYQDMDPHSPWQRGTLLPSAHERHVGKVDCPCVVGILRVRRPGRALVSTSTN